MRRFLKFFFNDESMGAEDHGVCLIWTPGVLLAGFM